MSTDGTNATGTGEWSCLTCRDTGQVWSADYDGTPYDQACPDCKTPYPFAAGDEWPDEPSPSAMLAGAYFRRDAIPSPGSEGAQA